MRLRRVAYCIEDTTSLWQRHNLTDEVNFTFKEFLRIISLFLPHTISVEGRCMRDKREDNGAAQMAWQLFEKTGSISYYMLYYDILRKK